MPDQRPPQSDADERQTLQLLLQFERDSMVRKVTGIDESAARLTPVASGTTLLWLITHLAQVERGWVLNRFAGEDVDSSDNGIPPEVTLTIAVDTYRETSGRVDKVVAAAPSLDEPCRNIRSGTPVNLRWVLMHLFGETARHAGHADILRELIDGQTGR